MLGPLELMLLAGSGFTAAFIVVGLFVSKRIRQSQIQYQKAKTAVDDIILSFNRQLRQENSRLQTVAFKVEALAGKSDKLSQSVNQIAKTVDALESEAPRTVNDKNQLLARLQDLEGKVRDFSTSHEAVSSKLTNLEELTRQLTALPENVEAAIPIRRDKAVSQLTLTELSALEILASEGPRTAPEIKQKIGLSREHTARLMKKLYEEGYLERETGKIPFKYSVKKEMLDLLKKPQPSQSPRSSE
jgi:chromosome segregation ATPase